MSNPKVRRDGVYSEGLAGETIVYDKVNHRAHTLNPTAAAVWEAADGSKSIDELARVLELALGIPAERSVVLLALSELQDAGLLESAAEMEPVDADTSRREMARRFALIGVSAALVPLVASVIAPTPAMAQSVITPY
jgi:hypothetical protein